MWEGCRLSNMEYPVNFAHGFRFFVVCCGLVTADVNHIF